MADFNKIILICRLTRDPELRTFGSGGKVAKLGVAVNNSKKNKQTGEWENEPVFLDVEAFDSQYGQKLATTVEQYTRKGSSILVEGRLVMDTWDDKATGAKRSKIKVMADTIKLLDKKEDRPAQAQSRAPASEPDDYPSDSGAPPSGAGEEIPF